MKFFLIVITLFISFIGISQVSTNYYSKIIIEDDITPQKAMEIQDYLIKFPGMLICRMDNFTHVLFVVYSNMEKSTNDNIFNYLSSCGYTVSCFFSDNYKQGKTVDLTIKNCQ